jgi:hypothetical protein
MVSYIQYESAPCRSAPQRKSWVSRPEHHIAWKEIASSSRSDGRRAAGITLRNCSCDDFLYAEEGDTVFFAHCIHHKPNDVQATALSKAAGVARFAYNWALDEWQRQYDLSKTDPALARPSQAALRRQLNAIKRSAFQWMLEVTKNAPQMATIQWGQAFDNFFSTSFPAIRGSAEKAVTTVLRSPTISSASKKNAFASRSWM